MFFLALMFLSTSIQCSLPTLKSIQHHTKNNNTDQYYIEQGSLILLFSNEVSLQLVKTNKISTNEKEFLFFIPCLTTNIEEKTFHSHYYKWSLTITQGPIPGILLHVTYHTKAISLLYEPVKNAYRYSGYIFTFINNEALNSIGSNGPIIKQAKKQKIIIDPGHGGQDLGACNNSLQEKDLTLTIGKALAKKLKTNGYNSLLTRKHDTTMQLTERTAFAHNHHGDIFISIHTNASLNQNAHGIETFYYKNEQNIIKDPSNNITVENNYKSYIQKKNFTSLNMAKNVQQHLCIAAQPLYEEKNYNRSYKEAPFQVLMGFNGPAILVELGFISNKNESELLTTKEYQHHLINGLYDGIVSFLDQSNQIL